MTTETGKQDDPNDPSTASVKKPFTLSHAGRVTISTDLAANDIDLYIVYDANNDGTFALSEIVGASAGGTGIESVTLVDLSAGLGQQVEDSDGPGDGGGVARGPVGFCTGHRLSYRRGGVNWPVAISRTRRYRPG